MTKLELERELEGLETLAPMGEVVARALVGEVVFICPNYLVIRLSDADGSPKADEVCLPGVTTPSGAVSKRWRPRFIQAAVAALEQVEQRLADGTMVR